MRVVFADPSRQAHDYQEIFVGKPQPEGAPAVNPERLACQEASDKTAGMPRSEQAGFDSAKSPLPCLGAAKATLVQRKDEDDEPANPGVTRKGQKVPVTQTARASAKAE
jgi:hypothetical protein